MVHRIAIVATIPLASCSPMQPTSASQGGPPGRRVPVRAKERSDCVGAERGVWGRKPGRASSSASKTARFGCSVAVPGLTEAAGGQRA